MSVCFLSCLVCVLFYFVVIFFFKQKTAYEMRISDWSSDVCSSDLPCHEQGGQQKPGDDAGDEQLDDRFFGQYAVDDHDDARRNQETERAGRSEERRVGKESDSTCRSWWSPYHTKIKIISMHRGSKKRKHISQNSKIQRHIKQ